MKRTYYYLLTAVLALPVAVFAQDAAVAAEAYPVASSHASGGFFTIVTSAGPLGLLNWLGIFIWAVIGLPLGIVSMIHCATTRISQTTLALKLLFLGVLSLFFLGCAGGAQGTIASFSHIACGSADTQLLAMSLAQALYSVAVAFSVALFYLFLATISVVVLHFKTK